MRIWKAVLSLLGILLIASSLWAWSRKPPVPATNLPLWGGCAGQFHKHAALTSELNKELHWQIVRWEISSGVVTDSIGYFAFRDSLLNKLNPPNIKVLLELRWNSEALHPASRIQHCVPTYSGGADTLTTTDWDDWAWFCFSMAYLFRNDNVWFQIGNEPEHENHKYWNGSIPEFIAYVNMGANAIKQANPNAYVVCGGFTGGRRISPAIEEVVAGLSDNIDALDRHFYKLDELPPDTLKTYLNFWPEYCHENGFDCFATELSPPYLDKAKEAGADCAGFFDLWGSAGGKYAAAKDGIATELGKRVGRWIVEQRRE